MRKPSQLKRTVKVLRNLATDIRLGGLYGTVSRPHGWSSHANAVAPTDYGALPYIFGDHIVRPDDVLVDVGCSRGRVIRRSATCMTSPTGSQTFFTGWPSSSCSRRRETQFAPRHEREIEISNRLYITASIRHLQYAVQRLRRAVNWR